MAQRVGELPGTLSLSLASIKQDSRLIDQKTKKGDRDERSPLLASFI
jgi:hypothetical protein